MMRSLNTHPKVEQLQQPQWQDIVLLYIESVRDDFSYHVTFVF